MSDPVSYHAIGHQPDVAEGEHQVHITQVGTWTPLFSLSPGEAELFAKRVLRAAARIREAELRGTQTTREERDEHLHLLSRDVAPPRLEPFEYARPPLQRPGVWQGRAAAGIFLAGLVVIAYGLIRLLGGTG